MWFIIVGSVIVALCLNGLLSSKASDVAADKGYDKDTWFHMCFWLGLLSYIIIAAMPDLKAREIANKTNQLLLELLEKQPAVCAPESNKVPHDNNDTSSQPRSATAVNMPKTHPEHYKTWNMVCKNCGKYFRTWHGSVPDLTVREDCPLCGGSDTSRWVKDEG